MPLKKLTTAFLMEVYIVCYDFTTSQIPFEIKRIMIIQNLRNVFRKQTFDWTHIDKKYKL